MNTEKSTDGLYEGRGEVEPGPVIRSYLKFHKSCDKSCSPSDWYKGGKCDLNGCFYEPENKLPDQKGWPDGKDVLREAIKLYPYSEAPLDPLDDSFVRHWNQKVDEKRDLFTEHFNYITKWLKTYLQPDTK